jgi:hypothetical protein
LFSVALLSGIRWATGTDWASYLSFYRYGGSLADYLSYPHFETGFKVVVWLFQAAGLSYSVWLFTLTSAVLFVKFAPILNRPYVLICPLVLFGMSLADLFPTRETLAISIVVLSAYYLSKGRYIIYVCLVLLAALFHTTALIFLFAPLIVRPSFAALIVNAIVFGLVLKFILFNAAIAVAGYLGMGNLLSAAELYSDTIAGRVSVFSIAQKSLILLFILLALPKCREYLTRFELFALKLTCFGMISSVFLESASQIFNRLTIYFVSFELIGVSALIYFYSKYLIARRSHIQLLGVFVGVCVVYAIRFCALLATYPDLYYPFETVFQNIHRTTY